MSDITKKALLDAFGNVLARKPMSKITISDITAECGLSRMTFYYHFKDIYDLIEWALETQLERAMTHDTGIGAWKQNYLSVFYFALENKATVLKIFPEMEHKYLRRYLIGLAHRLCLGFIEDKAKGMDVDEADKQFMASTYACTLVGVLINWANAGMKEQPELVVRRVGAMLEGNVEFSLSNFAAMKKDNALSIGKK